MRVKAMLTLARNAILTSLEYRTSFVAGFLSSLAWALSTLFFWQIVFQHTHMPFSDEIFLALGLLYIYYALDDIIFSGLWYIEDVIVDGVLDNILARPFRPLTYLLLRHIDAPFIPTILIPFIFFAQIKHPLSPFSIILGLTIFFLGVAMVVSLIIALESLCFWFGRENAISDLVWTAFYSAMPYPILLFPGPARLLFSILIPVGVIQILPADIMVRGIPLWALLGLFSAGLCFIGIALAIWEMGLRRYESAGG